mmetsp:Transcript_10448/g.14769  ORF Transcript_10448/g.14769 Transcript_10448/m.14769 type:complete len:178 (+) Transcript_10448:787-1320(+)
MFCTSIGVVSLAKEIPEVVVGVIYNPILNEMVSAIKGKGCYINDKIITNSEKDDEKMTLDQSLVNIGFPVSSESTLNASSKTVASLATKVRGLRMIASASQVMSWVAQAKLDAYISWDLNAWDVAAGMIIVQEAGGCVRNFDGSTANILSRDMIVTSNKYLNEELREVLSSYDCLTY